MKREVRERKRGVGEKRWRKEIPRERRTDKEREREGELENQVEKGKCLLYSEEA